MKNKFMLIGVPGFGGYAAASACAQTTPAPTPVPSTETSVGRAFHPYAHAPPASPSLNPQFLAEPRGVFVTGLGSRALQRIPTPGSTVGYRNRELYSFTPP